MKHLLLAALVAGAVGSITVPAGAQVVYVDTPPPPPRAERMPAPRHGYVWSPGHWEWRRGHHVWMPGQWYRERPGYVYQAPAWVQRDGRWMMEGGRWDRGGRRDRDGDGVPNRYDARPNNPNRS